MVEDFDLNWLLLNITDEEERGRHKAHSKAVFPRLHLALRSMPYLVDESINSSTMSSFLLSPKTLEDTDSYSGCLHVILLESRKDAFSTGETRAGVEIMVILFPKFCLVPSMYQSAGPPWIPT